MGDVVTVEKWTGEGSPPQDKIDELHTRVSVYSSLEQCLLPFHSMRGDIL